MAITCRFFGITVALGVEDSSSVSLCLCGFSPATPASSHCKKMCTEIGQVVMNGCSLVCDSPVMNSQHVQGEPCLHLLVAGIDKCDPLED